MSRLCESQAALPEVEKVRVLTTTANGAEELAVPTGKMQDRNGAQVTYFKRWTKDHSHFSPALLLELWRVVRDYQVVHIHSWWNLVTMPAVLICWLQGVKPVLSPRGMLSSYGQQNSRARLKSIFQKSLGIFLLRRTILHGTAEQEIREGQQIIPNWSYFEAPNIIELPDLDQTISPQPKKDVLRLVFLSRIHHKKGLDLLFHALSALDFPWELQIVGSGEELYLKELRLLSAELGIASQLHWEGWLSGAAKYEVLQAADLFVLTSRNENFANVVLEALAVGTPVLLSDQVGMGEYVMEKELGWICPLAPDVLAKQLESIYREKEKLIILGDRAKNLVRQDFAAQNIARQYISHYESLLNG